MWLGDHTGTVLPPILFHPSLASFSQPDGRGLERSPPKAELLVWGQQWSSVPAPLSKVKPQAGALMRGGALHLVLHGALRRLRLRALVQSNTTFLHALCLGPTLIDKPVDWTGWSVAASAGSLLCGVPRKGRWRDLWKEGHFWGRERLHSHSV